MPFQLFDGCAAQTLGHWRLGDLRLRREVLPLARRALELQLHTRLRLVWRTLCRRLIDRLRLSEIHLDEHARPRLFTACQTRQRAVVEGQLDIPRGGKCPQTPIRRPRQRRAVAIGTQLAYT